MILFNFKIIFNYKLLTYNLINIFSINQNVYHSFIIIIIYYLILLHQNLKIDN